MNYLPRSRQKALYPRSVAFLVGLFLIGAVIFSFFNNFIIKVISPLWRAENGFSRGLGKSVDFFHTRATLTEENVRLRERITSLEGELSTLALIKDNQASLLNLLGREATQTGITASILTHPPQSPYDLIIVDVGSDDYVVENARVALPEGPEIGTVSQVFPSFSRVKLFSTPGEKTQAILERHEVPVELIGAGGGNFKIVVPRDTQVEVGDRILSASLKATLLAVVGEVNLEPTDSFKEILAQGPANIFSVRFIQILP